MSQPIISLINVSKTFPLVRQREISLRYEASAVLWKWLHPQNPTLEAFYALQGISFTVQRGETVALMGRNGSGKTTLLRILAGVLRPSTGKATISGNFAPLLGLGAGFNTALTGRQNIILNAALLGLDRPQTAAVMDEIIAFADIGGFIDVPLKTYSSGMSARLGISVALICAPDILLIDEILAVGDGAFQQKCWAKLLELKQSGRTLLVVSHLSTGIEQVCERGIWLDRGQLQEDGDLQTTLNHYQKALYG